jgi:alpha-beta hydrolase superfamily lysophospholipase
MAGLRYVDVWLRAGPRREWVHGWFLPNDRHAPVVLLLHGTGRTIAGMVHVAAAIHRAGAAVLMIDYRGLGRSSRQALTETTMSRTPRPRGSSCAGTSPIRRCGSSTATRSAARSRSSSRRATRT